MDRDTLALLAADIRHRAFRLPELPGGPDAGRPWRARSADGVQPAGTRGAPLVGLEVELLPLDASGAIVPIHGPGGSLAFLTELAARRGWRESVSPTGSPQFEPGPEETISYEPGGQIEYGTAPYASAARLLARAHGVLSDLCAGAEAAGVRLEGLGIEPGRPLAATSLRLTGDRYRRMDAYFGGLGPAGPRMMRQTGSLQINVDFGPDPLAAFRVANALAAPLTAIFANSPVYDGRPTGHASYRADAWRRLDPGRTGVTGPASDPVAGYVRFALEAHWFLGPGEPAPFGELLRSGDVGLDHWRTHLTTLFPEVRPKGWLEIRSCDALPPGALAAPVVLLLGILHHPPTLAEAAANLPPPSPELLVRAGHEGLRDAEVAALARSVVALGLRGARSLGVDRLSARDLDAAEAFFDAYTLRGRAPADAVLALPPAASA
ncbi:MAG TPA: glutamate-cysteine ligase family protein [Longimicrobiales bacterium]|nr:glutamate-cysteine ligase family protein [Longimicrobiales bacterium]